MKKRKYLLYLGLSAIAVGALVIPTAIKKSSEQKALDAGEDTALYDDNKVARLDRPDFVSDAEDEIVLWNRTSFIVVDGV